MNEQRDDATRGSVNADSNDSGRDRLPDDLGTRRLTNDDPLDDVSLEDVFEAFGARDAIEHPGTPTDEPESPTSDADLQPPQ